MATIERPKEVTQSPDPLLATAIPTPFPRELLQSAPIQQEDTVTPATVQAIFTTDSTIEHPTQDVRHESTRDDMVSG